MSLLGSGGWFATVHDIAIHSTMQALVANCARNNVAAEFKNFHTNMLHVLNVCRTIAKVYTIDTLDKYYCIANMAD